MIRLIQLLCRPEERFGYPLNIWLRLQDCTHQDDATVAFRCTSSAPCRGLDLILEMLDRLTGTLRQRGVFGGNALSVRE